VAVMSRESETVPRSACRRSGIAEEDGKVTGNGGKENEGLHEGPDGMSFLLGIDQKKGSKKNRRKRQKKRKSSGRKAGRWVGG